MKAYSSFLASIMVVLLVLASSFIWVGSGLAGIPEPNTQIYGSVVNVQEGAHEPITKGVITYTLRKKSDINASYTYTTPIECAACTQYVNGQCHACNQYIYRLEVPQITADAVVNTQSAGKDLPLSDKEIQYDYVEISVDGKPARIVPKWSYGSKTTYDPGSKYIVASQTRRSYYYRVDLEVNKPLVDTDQDGIPDFWEERYKLDKSSSGDASLDINGNGLSNLQEYLLQVDPTTTDFVPILEKRHSIQVPQKGRAILFLKVLDKDSKPANLLVELKKIPDGGSLVLRGAATESGSGLLEDKLLKVGDTFSVEQVMNGFLHFVHTDNKIAETSFDVTVTNELKKSANFTLQLNVWSPTRTDGTEATYWADIDRDAVNKSSTDILEVLQDYSGSKVFDLGANVWKDLNSVVSSKSAKVMAPTSGNGKPVIQLDGATHFDWSSKLPVFPDGVMTLFSVFKSTGSKEQTLISAPYFQLGVTDKEHSTHPHYLKMATANGAVYGTQALQDNLAVVGVTRSTKDTVLELGGLWAGGPEVQPQTTTMPFDASMGAKALGKKHVEGFEGDLGEILVFANELPFEQKWKTIAYLQSKWLNSVVYDGSHESKAMVVKATSAAFSEVDRYAEEYIPKYGRDDRYIMMGGAGNQTLIGGHENDLLISPGSNILYGKGGQDVFVVNHNDVIMDFSEADGDAIHLQHLMNNRSGKMTDYIHFQTDGTNTLLMVNKNGDGKNFTDAQITLIHNSYTDADIPRLWAGGFLNLGAIRPELKVELRSVIGTSIESSEHPASFEIVFGLSNIPKDLIIPLEYTGAGVIGKDFVLETDVYNPQKKLYETIELKQGLLPIRLKAGDVKQMVRIVPVTDRQSEGSETFSLAIGSNKALYDVQSSQVTFSILDGPDWLSIHLDHPVLYKVSRIPAKITIHREGSIDKSLTVLLDIRGTAKNGVDYHYIPTEIVFAKDEAEKVINIMPIFDPKDKTNKVVEILLPQSTKYEVDGVASAIVTIKDLSDNRLLDVDGDGAVTALTDGMLALRYMMGHKGDMLTQGAIHPDRCTICDAATIEVVFSQLGTQLDIDGNGKNDAVTDGQLLLRYLFGFRGQTLIDGIVASDCMRCTASSIETYLMQLTK
ncbi:MAG: type I secretion C-terminal target domain-containing protein [Magnetococcus sp. YQC-5]